ncbi:GMC oxidoreductase [Mesobacterium pallidum]|uniref:GMC oxidoreductase n=1 Tax=Mesobacterium pallidum TaxID=2872037 RepID=UPI001EE390F4|nr:GMC family oxidoreductase [Mesobacterium pallidum]
MTLPDGIAGRTLDVIVIGAGMGGGLAARALAEAGLDVLILEKGRAGLRSERQDLSPAVFDPVARTVRGYWPDPVRARVDGREAEVFAPLGMGVGGSSVFYAATLERPERHDLDHSEARPHPTGGWPIRYDEFAPWLGRAETLLKIHGTPDPLSAETAALRDPPPADPGDARLIDRMTAHGLHPYRAHMAVAHLPGCLDCMGRKCPRPCKMDGRSAGVEPALATGHAALLTECDVQALRGTEGTVTGLDVRRYGETHRLSARAYVLAAGALSSPRLLLASTDWAGGAANGSGLVGRGLMFHLNEMFALWPRGATTGPSRGISLRDLYWQDGQRWGTIQSMGVEAGYGEILHYLRQMLARSRWDGRAAREAARLPAALAARMLGRAKVFVGLMEDLPYDDNRVTLDPSAPDRITFDYTLPEELLTRRRAYRRAIRRAMRGQRMAFLTRGPELNFGHPSGTLRFGADPATSVLNADCRAHGLGNLWVADASFMPTSMGTNPSLTIAANALRVGGVVAREIKEGRI